MRNTTHSTARSTPRSIATRTTRYYHSLRPAQVARLAFCFQFAIGRINDGREIQHRATRSAGAIG
jgi:hypothetical protein